MSGLPLDVDAVLLIEVDGHPAQVEEDAPRSGTFARSMAARFSRPPQRPRKR